MSGHAKGWNANAPRIARRVVLKQIAAAGVAASAPAFPTLAEEGAKPSASGTLAQTLARYAAGFKYEDLPEDIVGWPSGPSSTPSAAPMAVMRPAPARSRSSLRVTSRPGSPRPC